MKRKLKKYRTGGNFSPNYTVSPEKANSEADIMLAKAESKAMADPIAGFIDTMAPLLVSSFAGIGGDAPVSGKTKRGHEALFKGKFGALVNEEHNLVPTDQQAAVEAEGNEVVDDPQRGTYKVDGPSHDQGGVPVPASPGTAIFSDKVLDSKGVSMAKRKLKREKGKQNLLSLLEEDSTDVLLRNAFSRQSSTSEAEEAQDLETQQKAALLAELVGLPHAENGNLPKAAFGIGKNPPYFVGGVSVEDYNKHLDAYRLTNSEFNIEDVAQRKALQKKLGVKEDGLFGPKTFAALQNSYPISTPSEDELSVAPDITDDNPEQKELGFPVKKIGFSLLRKAAVPPRGVGLNSSHAGGDEEDGGGQKKSPPKEGYMPTAGDMLKLFGNAFGAIAPFKNTEDARAAQKSHPNHYEDVGKEAEGTLRGAMDIQKQIRDNQRQRIRSLASGAKNSQRASARSVNTMRALDLAVDAQSMQAEQDVQNAYAEYVANLKNALAQVQLQSSAAKSQGASEARDRADRDEGAYYTARAQNIANAANAMQQTGKDINQILQNPVMLALLENLAADFTIDSQGRLKQKDN